MLFRQSHYLGPIQTLLEPILKDKGTTALVVALSGGVDSVCLLRLLHCYLKLRANQFTLLAHHQQHNLRAEESKADELFCRDLCRELKIPLRVDSADVGFLATEEQANLEDVARRVRYDSWFRYRESLCCDYEQVFFLTAHHADDQAETFLLRLERGAGLRGLSAIPQQRGFILRPLLALSRDELVTLAIREQWAWREDSSNLETQNHRNYLRHKVLPLWAQSADPGLGKRIAHAAALLSQEQHMLERYGKSIVKSLRIKAVDALYPVSAQYYSSVLFRKLPYEEQGLVIRTLAQEQGISKDLLERQIDKMREILLSKGGSKALNLARRNLFYCDRRIFCLTSDDFWTHFNLPLADAASMSVELRLPFERQYCFHSVNRTVLTILRAEPTASKAWPTVFLEGCIIRHPKPGDWYWRDGNGHSERVLLKTFLTEANIPVQLRACLICLARENHIISLGVAGFPEQNFEQEENNPSVDSKISGEAAERFALLWYNSPIIE